MDSHNPFWAKPDSIPVFVCFCNFKSKLIIYFWKYVSFCHIYIITINPREKYSFFLTCNLTAFVNIKCGCVLNFFLFIWNRQSIKNLLQECLLKRFSPLQAYGQRWRGTSNGRRRPKARTWWRRQWWIRRCLHAPTRSIGSWETSTRRARGIIL